jgi:hypothetical protein
VALGRRYVFPSNPEKFEAVTLERGAAGQTTLVVTADGRTWRLGVGSGTWVKGQMPFSAGGGEQPVAASGAWTSDNTYLATVAFYQTPFKLNVRLAFEGNTVVFGREMHVTFGETKLPTLTGHAQ